MSDLKSDSLGCFVPLASALVLLGVALQEEVHMLGLEMTVDNFELADQNLLGREASYCTLVYLVSDLLVMIVHSFDLEVDRSFPHCFAVLEGCCLLWSPFEQLSDQE